MSTSLSRRQFLRGRVNPGPAPVRPPWSSEASIAAHCERCDRCAEACPEKIIHAGEGGFPVIRFDSGACSFCGACADICPAPVFSGRDAAAWHLRPQIADGCLTAHGIYCRSCGDACPEGAIRFRPALGGRAEIAIDPAACNGCGACVSVCPRSVIAMVPAQTVQEPAHE